MLSEIILITEYEQSLQNFLTINRNHCYCYCYASKDIKKKNINVKYMTNNLKRRTSSIGFMVQRFNHVLILIFTMIILTI